MAHGVIRQIKSQLSTDQYHSTLVIASFLALCQKPDLVLSPRGSTRRNCCLRFLFRSARGRAKSPRSVAQMLYTPFLFFFFLVMHRTHHGPTTSTHCRLVSCSPPPLHYQVQTAKVSRGTASRVGPRIVADVLLSH
jgi:hypothetical protein